MEYACPVCGDPQVDRRHLANHLAFTALLRGGDHESWLDDRVPGWADRDEDALAEALAGLDDVDLRLDEPVEDLAGDPDTGTPTGTGSHAHGDETSDAGAPVDRGPAIDRGRGAGGPGAHDHTQRHDGGSGDGSIPSVDPIAGEEVADDEMAAILEEAEELTRRRREAGSDGGDDGEGATDSDAGTDSDGADADADR